LNPETPDSAQSGAAFAHASHLTRVELPERFKPVVATDSSSRFFPRDAPRRLTATARSILDAPPQPASESESG
jgi:hypothetical protein